LTDSSVSRRGQVTILGSGTSHGVPMIGCACAVCRSADPRDTRWRPSILIEFPDGVRVLVDTTPDLRAQALRFNIDRVDAILFTHSHADHILGLDEARRYNHLQRAAVPCYADARTLQDIRRTFSYIFSADPGEGGGVPKIDLFTLAGPFCLGRHEIVPVPLFHGSRPILGFRIGSFAYLTDTNRIPEASWPLLDGVTVLVLDALRDRPHPTHFTIAEALAVAARVDPRQTYFTHICHELGHAATCARLPAGVELAYDGLSFELPGV
jgi:phosphoribosyl 1,2-cyclic phosphate phosphodiesterase